MAPGLLGAGAGYRLNLPEAEPSPGFLGFGPHLPVGAETPQLVALLCQLPLSTCGVTRWTPSTPRTLSGNAAWASW